MTSTRCVLLFKGINVGKAKRLLMADLRRVLGDLGYRDVGTHLQSGNAVFDTDEAPAAVSTAVRKAVETRLGVSAAVVVRTGTQLAAAMAADPYRDVADDPARHLLGFFSAVPDAAKVAALRQLLADRGGDPDVVGTHHIAGEHCYLWCPQGILKSPFGTVDWDRALGVTVTMRNFSTVTKLLAMSQQ